MVFYIALKYYYCLREMALFIFCHLQLPVLPCGFSLLPSVVENLTGQTPRFTHFNASLLLFFASNFSFPTLFLTVGFMRPPGFKTLRQELSDAL